MKFNPIVHLIISFILLSCNGQISKSSKTLDAAAFSQKIAATLHPQILDVRTPEEFALDHIDTAININWLGDSFVSDTKKLDQTKPLFVYCKSGARSTAAIQKLEELGFQNMYQLQGGILKWDASGFSKPSDKITGMSLPDYTKLVRSNKKILINFYAEWCAPCKKMTPYLTKMQKDLADDVTIIRLDADQNKTLLAKMKITELPSLFLYKNAIVQWKHSGYISEEDLKKQL